MSLSAQPLFYKDYAVKELETSGDYETWARDIEEYFAVSNLSRYYQAIAQYEMPVMGEVPEEKKVELKALHERILVQARYAIYRSLGSTIKREIAKEHYANTTVLDLWVAVRNCFFLRNESTIQQLRDEITVWDMEKAGSWATLIEGLERMYSRLDTIAADRTYTSSDKLHKLRSILSKLDGEKEKSIFNQVELLVDTSVSDIKETYEKCFKFADKRMKIIDKPVAARHAAFQTTGRTSIGICNYCKKKGHHEHECRKKKTEW